MPDGIRVRFAPSPTGMFHVGGARSALFNWAVGTAQSRVTVLSEITTYVDWLFLTQPPEDEASWVKAMTPGAEDILASVRKRWTDADWTFEALRAGLQAAAAEHGLKLGKAQAPVRVAVTGRTVGLPLFESLEVFGRDRTLTRIDAAAARLAAHDERARQEEMRRHSR